MSVHLTEAERTPASLLDPRCLSEAAEEVRAWFVQVRGGAPFLSGADGAALAEWLESGIEVPRILRAIETTAGVRRARRHRRPFTLKSCAASLKGRTPPRRGAGGFHAAVEGVGEAGGEVGGEALGRGDSALGSQDVLVVGGPLLRGELAVRVAELRGFALDRLGAERAADLELRVRARCRIAREFHAEIWSALEPDRGRLLDEAAVVLADLAVGLDLEDFERLCEEHVRQRVRELFPELTVERICEEADLGLA